MTDLPPVFGRKVQTTNAIWNVLQSWSLQKSVRGLDFSGVVKQTEDWERYEEKEKEIPTLIYDVLKKESHTFTKLVQRSYLEEDAWLVRVECKEGEYLEDHAQEIYSGSKSGELLPLLFEEGDVAAHFVKIHVPKIFVRTVALPMIARTH